MKKFVFKVSVFVAIQLAILITLLAVWFPKSIDDNQYLAASKDKQQLLRRTPSPKVILIGGSNLVFSFQTDKLEAALGRSVVNMGLDCEFGLAYKLNEVHDYVHQGDLVILSLEYEHFIDEYTGELLNLLQYNPKSIRYIDPKDYISIFFDKSHLFVGNMIRASLHSLWNGVAAKASPPYSRNCFTKYEDIQAHYALENQPIYDNVFPAITPKPLKRAIRLLQKFSEHCRREGATLLYTFPPQPEARLADGKHKLGLLMKELAKLDIKIIGTPYDYIMNWECCYDNCYHLNGLGSERRTALLVADIRNYVESDDRLIAFQVTRIPK